MLNKEVSASFAIACHGVSEKTITPPLFKNPAGVSISVFKTGEREVGCVYLREGKCMADPSPESYPHCVHLFPESLRTSMESKFTPISSEIKVFRKKGSVFYRDERLDIRGNYELDGLELSKRVRNALIKAGLVYISEVSFAVDKNQLKKIRDIGPVSSNEILEALAKSSTAS